ncbi:hypothetical protein VN97_g5940 [Penicillium thymicola]|uniref:Uncharacterized protein n=1 Tax=Penicillium thymicola TaxID=293382 RepID=A0AAI9X8R1_PENTH|nr:hypothetical protein VN97_g5940 [Penicillium thymicola]
MGAGYEIRRILKKRPPRLCNTQGRAQLYLVSKKRQGLSTNTERERQKVRESSIKPLNRLRGENTNVKSTISPNPVMCQSIHKLAFYTYFVIETKDLLLYKDLVLG